MYPEGRFSHIEYLAGAKTRRYQSGLLVYPEERSHCTRKDETATVSARGIRTRRDGQGVPGRTTYVPKQLDAKCTRKNETNVRGRTIETYLEGRKCVPGGTILRCCRACSYRSRFDDSIYNRCFLLPGWVEAKALTFRTTKSQDSAPAWLPPVSVPRKPTDASTAVLLIYSDYQSILDHYGRSWEPSVQLAQHTTFKGLFFVFNISAVSSSEKLGNNLFILKQHLETSCFL